MRALFGVKGLGVLLRGQGKDQGSRAIKMAVGERVSAEIWSSPWLCGAIRSWSEVLFRDFDSPGKSHWSAAAFAAHWRISHSFRMVDIRPGYLL